jgi:hypothetical protein
MRHLSTLALGGIVSVLLLAGDAEACHKRTCGCAAPVACAPAPVVCARPAPARCPKPVKIACAPRVNKCGGGGLLAGLCHRKTSCAPAPCTTVVAYNYAPTYYGAPMGSGQYYPTPQAAGQSYATPPVPSKR